MFEKFINMAIRDDEDTINDSIVYTIVTLLSSRAPFSGTLDDHRQIGLAGFGIPCCQTHLNDNTRLRHTRKQKILLYEPRLSWATVYVDYGQNTLSFFIEGTLSGSHNIQLRISYPCHLHIT